MHPILKEFLRKYTVENFSKSHDWGWGGWYLLSISQFKKSTVTRNK